MLCFCSRFEAHLETTEFEDSALDFWRDEQPNRVVLPEFVDRHLEPFDLILHAFFKRDFFIKSIDIDDDSHLDILHRVGLQLEHGYVIKQVKEVSVEGERQGGKGLSGVHVKRVCSLHHFW